MTAAAPNWLGRACRRWSVCVCRRPTDFFHNHGTTAVAIDAPHRVLEEDEESPQRDELEAPLGELIVTARQLMAARADRGRAFAWPHGHLDTLLVRAEAGVLVDEPSEPVTAV